MTLFDEMSYQLFNFITREGVMTTFIFRPVRIVSVNREEFSASVFLKLSSIESEVHHLMEHTDEIIVRQLGVESAKIKS